MKTQKFRITFAESLSLASRPDALLLAYSTEKGHGLDFDVRIVRFQSREALEAIARKNGMRAVVPTQVPLNCAIHAFQSDSVARAALS